MATIAQFTEMMNWQIVDFYIDRPAKNIHKTFLQDAIGKNNIRPIAFGIRFWKKVNGEYQLVDISNSSVITAFHFTRADGKTKKITSELYEEHGFDENLNMVLKECFDYGVISAACTSVAGPFKLAVSVGDSSENLLRTVWIIEGNIADTESAVTF